MRVEWAIPCMGVAISPGGIIERIENAAFDVLTAQSLPAPLQFIVLARFVGQREEFTEEADRRVRASLQGPGMDELLHLDFEIPSGDPSADHPEGWEVNANVPVVIQFTPDEAGTYTLTFYVNDRAAWSLAFRIAAAG